MAKRDQQRPANIGMKVVNTGSGTGVHAEARGVGTTGMKVNVDARAQRGGLFAALARVFTSLWSGFKS